jgi:hypothetical protein
MKSAKDIKKLIRKINVSPAGPRDQKTLADILLAQEKTKKTCSADIGPSVGRIIMKSKITKFAAAAVIIMAVLIGVNWFGGSVDMATIAFAEISEAMKKVPWMHQVPTGFEGDAPGTSEQWLGFEQEICTSRLRDGKITFINMKEHKSYNYDPRDQTITINYVEDNDKFSLDMSSPASMLESMYKMLETLGAQIITKEAEYQGRKVQLQEISMSSVGPNNESMTMRLYIEPDSKLLLAAKVKGTNVEGKVIMDGEENFSYPDTGPLSIYDLGVPQDTKLVSNLPSKDYQQILDSYRQARLNSTKEYTAIIIHLYQPLSHAITTVDVDYKLNRKHRCERHAVFKAGDQCDRCWPSYNEKLGSSFESLLAWANAHYKETGYISINLYDGEYSISTTRDDPGVWDKPKKDYAPYFEMPNIGLENIGWPWIGNAGQIIEDDYSVNNELICIERLQQGSVDSGNVNLPGRFLYYLDPRKNYICVRQVTEWCPDADWQRDKNWLDGVEIEKVRDGSITIEDITETTQAENGLWYPKHVEEKQTGIRKDYKNVPLNISVVKKIYVETNRTFPEGIFDIAGLSQ